jgi:hypothetical protein
MAFFFGDSFDLYSNAGGMTEAAAGHWDASSLNPGSSGFTTGRFAGSRAWNCSSSTRMEKTSGQNDAVHHIVFATAIAQNLGGTNNGLFFTVYDGATAQCSVVVRSDGSIIFTQGGSAGTILGTYNGAITTRDIWYAFEVEFVVHNTAGSVAIRKNGNIANDFFLGGLDTAVTANNYANKMGCGTQSGVAEYVDDILWRSDAVSVPWVGDIRCYPRMPLADVSKQFSFVNPPYNIVINSKFGAQSYAANFAKYARFTATFGGTVTGATVAFDVSGGGSTGNVRMALFAMNATGGVGTLLATSPEIIAPTNQVYTVTFPTPPRIERGQSYYLGMNQSASITSQTSSTANALENASSPYASWPVSNPTGLGNPGNLPGGLGVTITPTLNADALNEPQQDALTSYVYSTANGQSDLYTVAPIATVPLAILGITTRGYFQKSDAGTRNVAVQLKSGATTVQSASQSPATAVWGWIERTDVVDPATGVAWTPAGANNVQIGPVVTA